MIAALALTPRDGIGGNNPPSPFDLSRDEIEGLYGEALNFLDGEPVTTQVQADTIGKLMDLLRKAGNLADERRFEEKRPHDEAAAEVQSRYNPLIAGLKTATKGPKGKVKLALETCDKALVPFLTAETARKEAAAEEARQKARQAAEAAAVAFQASSHDDLAGRAEAEAMATAAKEAEAAARRAAKDGAKVGGGARAVTLRTVVRAEVTDRRAFLNWVAANRADELTGMLQGLAERLSSASVRGLPGVSYREEHAAR